MFCPNCDNILNISTNAPVSHEENIEEHSSSIIDSILNEEEVSDMTINDVEIISSSDAYKKLNKNNKKVVDDALTAIERIKQTNDAFLMCSNCSYNKPIKPRTLITRIASKTTEGISSMYINTEKFKNIINNPALPRTRNYKCMNELCSTHKNSSEREAIFFRNNMQTWYVCTVCKTYWKV